MDDQWLRDKASANGGWVVQHVDAPFDVKDCDDNKMKSVCDNGNWGYWEAWQVNKG